MTVISINTLYIAGMIYIDIPNYIINWMTKKHIYLSIPDGLYKTTYCNKVSADLEIWLPHIKWMTPYFTIAVWISILMSYFQTN